MGCNTPVTMGITLSALPLLVPADSVKPAMQPTQLRSISMTLDGWTWCHVYVTVAIRASALWQPTIVFYDDLSFGTQTWQCVSVCVCVCVCTCVFVCVCVLPHFPPVCVIKPERYPSCLWQTRKRVSSMSEESTDFPVSCTCVSVCGCMCMPVSVCVCVCVCVSYNGTSVICGMSSRRFILSTLELADRSTHTHTCMFGRHGRDVSPGWWHKEGSVGHTHTQRRDGWQFP